MNKYNLNITPLNEWLSSFKKPLIISGPCGAETEKQVLQTASELAKLNAVTIFRSGIWKPRTRPNSFEGAGPVGLQWLKKVKEQFGFLTTVEVATAEHVNEAIKNGVDVLWIGARTTVNPFSVQEIADALQGINIPVMVKNPVNADVLLWIGALERLNQAGITKLIAVHRGFYTYDKGIYRNPPHWEIPIQLKTFFPHLPIICDPSHIGGSRELVLPLAQKALDLSFDGLMIESHCDPENALSDKQQQITPSQLGTLLKELVIRETHHTSKEFSKNLRHLRSIIDEIDEEIINWLAKRMDVVEQIGSYKKENNITVLQLERWLEILKTRSTAAESKGLNKDFIQKICEVMHKESIRQQTELVNQSAKN